jgi:antitoxin (DNA-binding transcriptional repressor) of toxin-antitoxin stability system
MVMMTVNVAALKEKLSHYLALVKGGAEIVVTSYETRIARIVPVASSGLEIREPVRPPSDLRKLKGVKPRSVSAVDVLIQDRRAR